MKPCIFRHVFRVLSLLKSLIREGEGRIGALVIRRIGLENKNSFLSTQEKVLGNRGRRNYSVKLETDYYMVDCNNSKIP